MNGAPKFHTSGDSKHITDVFLDSGGGSGSEGHNGHLWGRIRVRVRVRIGVKIRVKIRARIEISVRIKIKGMSITGTFGN